jgi:hypothetical protein
MKFKRIICCLLAILTMSIMVADAAGWIPSLKEAGTTMAVATVFGEVWTGEVANQIKASEEGTFIDGIDSYDQYVGNDVIHLVDAGVEPDVLVNNTTYPIAVQTLSETDISISLDKFQTKVTPITDDELYAISYDKMTVVKTKHGNAITKMKLKKAIHAFAPASNSANTPVIFTSSDEALEGTRKRMTREEIIKMKKKFDDMECPNEGRRLILCSDHVQDLLLQDQKFADQYYNYTTGKIANLYGFEVYEYSSCPLYTVAGAKKALGAVAVANEYQASVAVYVPNLFKAKGETKMYYSEAGTDPEYQRNKINFRHMFIALPKTQKYIGAICSGIYVAED